MWAVRLLIDVLISPVRLLPPSPQRTGTPPPRGNALPCGRGTPSGVPSPPSRGGSRRHRGLDILVQTEHVDRVIPLLQDDQPFVCSRAVDRAHTVRAFV